MLIFSWQISLSPPHLVIVSDDLICEQRLLSGGRRCRSLDDWWRRAAVANGDTTPVVKRGVLSVRDRQTTQSPAYGNSTSK